MVKLFPYRTLCASFTTSLWRTTMGRYYSKMNERISPWRNTRPLLGQFTKMFKQRSKQPLIRSDPIHLGKRDANEAVQNHSAKYGCGFERCHVMIQYMMLWCCDVCFWLRTTSDSEVLIRLSWLCSSVGCPDSHGLSKLVRESPLFDSFQHGVKDVKALQFLTATFGWFCMFLCFYKVRRFWIWRWHMGVVALTFMWTANDLA